MNRDQVVSQCPPPDPDKYSQGSVMKDDPKQGEQTNDAGGNSADQTFPFLKSYRKWTVMVFTLSMTITFATQSSMSSALVCMIPASDDNASSTATNNLTTATAQPNQPGIQSTERDFHFNWDKDTQGWVLSSFFIGYAAVQVPSGIAVTTFGPKKLLVVSLILLSVFQVLTVPAALVFGVEYLYVVRVLAGVVCGIAYAPTFSCAGHWIPKGEVSLMFGVIGSGMELGNMLSFLISTFACQVEFQGGWPLLFYILASIGGLTAFLIAVFISDSPHGSRFVSKEELHFLSASVPKPASKDTNALGKIPFKSILTSMPVWAVVVSQLGSDWLYYFLVIVAPLYLKEVVRLSETQTNFLSGVPFVFLIPTIYVAGFLSNRLIANNVSVTNTRKINDLICKLIPGMAVVGLGFVPQGGATLVFLLNSVAAAFYAFSYMSWLTNPVDIAGGYTGLVVGLCEGLVMWVGVVVPVVTEAVTVDKTREQWQTMFFMTGALQIVTSIFYLAFASGELQPWAVSTFEFSSDQVDTKSVTQSELVTGLNLSPGVVDQKTANNTHNSEIQLSQLTQDSMPESGLSYDARQRAPEGLSEHLNSSGKAEVINGIAGGQGGRKRCKDEGEKTPLLRT